MKIYFGHSQSYDFEAELYQPIRNSRLWTEHEFILPHKNSKTTNTKKIIQTCDIMVAEVSQPSTGLGIELGWADFFMHPIIGIYHKGSKVSKSLNVVCKEIVEYIDQDDMIVKLGKALKKIKV